MGAAGGRDLMVGAAALPCFTCTIGCRMVVVFWFFVLVQTKMNLVLCSLISPGKNVPTFKPVFHGCSDGFEGWGKHDSFERWWGGVWSSENREFVQISRLLWRALETVVWDAKPPHHHQAALNKSCYNLQLHAPILLAPTSSQAWALWRLHWPTLSSSQTPGSVRLSSQGVIVWSSHSNIVFSLHRDTSWLKMSSGWFFFLLLSISSYSTQAALHHCCGSVIFHSVHELEVCSFAPLSFLFYRSSMIDWSSVCVSVCLRLWPLQRV